MDSDKPLPRELKAVATASLLELEERALDLGLSQRLPPSWVAANAAPAGTHYLWPALWRDLPHRPDVPPHLRCELLIALRTGERVRGLLDVLPGDFASLPKVTSRTEGTEVSRFLDSAPSIRDWLLREGEVLF
ncbi:hypothetical protein SAMN04489712_13033 [Thermomonospora echinospora]|uniref:Uncharacterized protein n=1 Tax=Thermomonospora echinospora TaxID=1992 RepID=A0A1H6E232_9ACTN|nr:hypothetical protein [Thermomonospora echinospora]SEG91728.1 hypothetical protein SAMN04489712_13033 [Thermomonospora echinospora]